MATTSSNTRARTKSGPRILDIKSSTGSMCTKSGAAGAANSLCGTGRAIPSYNTGGMGSSSCGTSMARTKNGIEGPVGLSSTSRAVTSSGTVSAGTVLSGTGNARAGDPNGTGRAVTSSGIVGAGTLGDTSGAS